MSHKKMKPVFAPRAVVNKSSPDPTIVPAKMIPGPIILIALKKDFGGSRMASVGIA